MGASNSYGGATLVNGGRLKAGAAGAFPSGSAFTIGANGTLDLDGFSQSVGSLSGAGALILTSSLTAGSDNSSTAYSGVASGTGGLTKLGSGTMVLSGNSSFNGPLTIGGGTVSTATVADSGSNSPLGADGNITLSNGGVLQYSDGGASTNRGIVLDGGGGGGIDVSNSSATLTLSGILSGTGNLVKTSGGTLVLSGVNNTYNGSTTLSGGTLKAGAVNAFSQFSGHVVEATLDLNGYDQTIGSLSNNGTTLGAVLVSANLHTNALNNATTTYGGSLSGTGTLIKEGGGTLHLTNVRTGGLMVNGGVVHVMASGLSATSTSVLSAAPVIGATAQLDLEDNALIVNYDAADTSQSVRDQVRNLLVNGRNGGAGGPGYWNGAGGITSTYANARGNGFNLSMAYADNEDLAAVRAAGSYTAFGGQTVASNCVLVQMTRGADATMDGVVDSQDVTINGAHFNKPGSGQWCFGDSDYSGMCDSTDVTTLGTTFGKTTPILSPSQLGSGDGTIDLSRINLTSPYGLSVLKAMYGEAFEYYFELGLSQRTEEDWAVPLGSTATTMAPEPGSLAVLGLGGVVLVTSRRRKRRFGVASNGKPT